MTSIDNEVIRKYMQKLTTQAQDNLRTFTDICPVVFFLRLDGSEIERRGMVYRDDFEKAKAQKWVNDRAKKLQPAVIVTLNDSNIRNPTTGDLMFEAVVIRAFGPGIDFALLTPYLREGSELVMQPTMEHGKSPGETSTGPLEPWWESNGTVN
jgi:hypothetical protein